jgi:hypothetical protein
MHHPGCAALITVDLSETYPVQLNLALTFTIKPLIISNGQCTQPPDGWGKA